MSDDPFFEFLKTEYEKAADRYNSIYQSIWTIFSYMSAVTAAFLAFGGEHIAPWAMASFAPIPLVFWFWSTYLPLDRYGNKTLGVLRDIEKRANEKYSTALNHYSKFARDKHGLLADFFEKVKKGCLVCATWDMVSRARFAIVFAFVALHLFLALAVYRWSSDGFTFFKKDEVQQPVYRLQIESSPAGVGLVPGGGNNQGQVAPNRSQNGQ